MPELIEIEPMTTHLSMLHPLNQEDLECIAEVAELASFNKKELIVEEGQVAKYMYFVTKGACRQYFNKDGEEICALFFLDGQFATVLASFIPQLPSIQNLEAMEDVEAIGLSHEALYHLYETRPNIERVGRMAMERRYVFAQMLLASHIMDTPEQRYQKLLQNEPELVNRIPQSYLASYLGVTPVSLSRIRKRIFTKK